MAPLQRLYTLRLLQDPIALSEQATSQSSVNKVGPLLVSACMCLGESLLGPLIEDTLAWAWDSYSERSIWGAALTAGILGVCLLGPLDSIRTR
jgi:hypothetical protein